MERRTAGIAGQSPMSHPAITLTTTLAALATLILSGCAIQPVPEPPTGAPPDFPLARYARGETWQVTTADLRVRVYRAGRLKRLGHNHIVSSTSLAGLANRDGADLYLPAAALTVDDPALRADAGPGFEKLPSERDIAGTRANLLGPSLLDATRYPYIEARIRNESGGFELPAPGGSTQTIVLATVRLAGATTTVSWPVSIRRVTPTDVEVTGAVTLSHTDLGLTPFSALAGAISVAEDLELAVRMTWQRRDR